MVSVPRVKTLTANDNNNNDIRKNYRNNRDNINGDNIIRDRVRARDPPTLQPSTRCVAGNNPRCPE